MRSGWRSRMVGAWREDHVGERDLTRWPSRVGRGTVRATAWTLERVRRVLPDRLTDADLPWVVLAVIVGVGGALVVATTMLSTLLYESVVEKDGVAALDQPVLDWMVARRTPTLDTWVTHYTDLGSTTYMTPRYTIGMLS